MTTSASTDLVPPWGRRAAIFLALGLLVFALHRYLGGFDAHVRYVRLIALEFADVQLPVIRDSPLSEHLHRLGGSALILAGLLQFSDRLRRRRPATHRAIGMIYVGLALLAGISGPVMAWLHPFGGLLEVIPSVVFGAALCVVTAIALVLARRRRFEAHREWMTRSYAIALGPMMVRVVYVPIWMLLGVAETTTIWVSFWLGWSINIAVAEAWIRGRRRRLARAARRDRGL